MAPWRSSRYALRNSTIALTTDVDFVAAFIACLFLQSDAYFTINRLTGAYNIAELHVDLPLLI